MCMIIYIQSQDICQHDYLDFTSQMIQERFKYQEYEMFQSPVTRTATFVLNQQQRSNINKRLPLGFSLTKVSQIGFYQKFDGDINYTGEKRPIRVADEQLAEKFILETQMIRSDHKEVRTEERSVRLGQIPDGRSKHSQRIKIILQRFRKHPKFSLLFQHLRRLGFSNALQKIQAQNRKNIHTIQSFKERVLLVLNKAVTFTSSSDMVDLIQQMIDDLSILIDMAQKTQFINSLQNMQKGFDKLTRQMTEMKEVGSFYYKKRKRGQKTYSEKELLYISELVKTLPFKDMVGVIEIVYQKPFHELNLEKFEFDLNGLKNKKISQIEFYVKKKLSNHYRSVQSKHQKRQQQKQAQKGSTDQMQKKSEKQNQKVVLNKRQSMFDVVSFFEGRGQAQLSDAEELMKKQAEIAFIFQEEDVERSFRGLSEIQPFSASESEEYFNERGQDNLGGSSPRSNQPYSGQDSSALRQGSSPSSRQPASGHESSSYKQSSSPSPNRPYSGYDSQPIRQSSADNQESEQPNLYLDNQSVQRVEGRELVEQERAFQSSDSSYITDQEDSQF